MPNLKLFIITVFFVFLAFTLGKAFDLNKKIILPSSTPQVTPLAKYTINNLRDNGNLKGKITVGEKLKEDKNNTSYLFNFQFYPDLDVQNPKNTSGLLNIPESNDPLPLIVLLRGYVDQANYQSGMGSSRVGEYFSNNGFITIAPDFLGYGQSDSNSGDILESRFQTYTTVQQLLNSLSDLNNWDQKNLFLWGHSNGGQIALTILEIINKEVPTVIWAPVSKPFPYSILFYTDESDDKGKLVRKAIADFENTYSVDDYSFTEKMDFIKSPILIHQGTADEAVPLKWSQDLAKILKADNIPVELVTHADGDHNLTPGWNEAVARDLVFFRSLLK